MGEFWQDARQILRWVLFVFCILVDVLVLIWFILGFESGIGAIFGGLVILAFTAWGAKTFGTIRKVVRKQQEADEEASSDIKETTENADKEQEK